MTKQNKKNPKIVFLGAGKMAAALAKGMLKKVSVENLSGYDISGHARHKFTSETGVRCVNNIKAALSFSDAVIIAVKPQNFSELFEAIGKSLEDKLIISVMAGVTLSKLIEKSGSKKVVRVMPNTPALIGEGMSVYCCSDAVSTEEISLVEMMLSSVGKCLALEEKYMDAVTGLSGSGPAYVFEFIEALKEGGVGAGLDAKIAYQLAVQTVKGAVELLIETGEEPSKLRDNVTSPGGTTAKGLEVLNNNSFRKIIGGAIAAATQRSIELGKK
jgi:pyrroline-5-carboxylate reductase